MTYTNPNQKRLFFDVETASNPESCALMADPKPDARLKDPEKIREDIEAKRAALIEQAALDPDYGKILSIGYSTSLEKPVTVKILGDVYFAETGPAVFEQTQMSDVVEYIYSECDLIEDFWDAFCRCSGCAIGYNVLGFDLPYLLRRSMALGVKVPFIPNLAKFRTEPVTDLMAILYNWGNDRYKSLKQVAKLYHIPVDYPDVDGSQVKDMDLRELRNYQASDVRLVQRLHARMNGVYFCH